MSKMKAHDEPLEVKRVNGPVIHIGIDGEVVVKKYETERGVEFRVRASDR